MPIKKSAKKALRQAKRRQIQNLKKKKAAKSISKKIKKLITEKKIEEAKKLLSSAYKAIDKAAKTKVIPKNTASRQKSQLAKLFKQVESSK
jgi:small subunit ribosomal protein S20